jgi:hypothetical protein
METLFVKPCDGLKGSCVKGLCCIYMLCILYHGFLIVSRRAWDISAMEELYMV